ncbi:DUF5683 domain-containing protein [Gelidibacter salicanalis]|uniref:DUF5683 domain-containing protein n=1 Tax=Gelidibacter salicanalis TaxID=291193 RepID=A0A934KSH2_9FLAO|nr:DUF5683 domain-containing protein [Gelidibacter salicanalis]MBJ7879293.1 hypothetical protein [Gelidibacter salicanalis]
MLNKRIYIPLVILCFVSVFGFSQTETDSIPTVIDSVPNTISNEVVIDSIVRKPLNILAPSKAAFYSAILPGLGQAYNKKYWKIPIVYAAIGTGIYVYLDNDKTYKRYRDIYKRRLAGFTDDEFYGDGPTPKVSNEGLIRAQNTLRRNKELSLLITFGLYALNIIDANVDAHLLQYNLDENLALKPHFQYNEQENSTDLGVTLNFKF